MPLLSTGSTYRNAAPGGGGSAHRYWRLLVSTNEVNSFEVTSSTLAIAEIELRETISGSDVTGSGTASADSTSGGTTAADAFDNNTATKWSSGTAGYPHWIKYDFGSGNDKSIVEVALTSPSSTPTQCARDFDVQWSDDDSAWTTAFSVYGEDQWTATETRVFSARTVPALATYAGADPGDILGSALKAWYPSDLITGSNGDPQAYLEDRSGNGKYGRQVTSGKRPTLVTADLNGLNVLRYTGANSTYFALNQMLSGAAAMYLVQKLANDPPGTHFGCWNFGTDGNMSHHPFSDGNVYEAFASTGRKSAGNPTPSLASYRIVNIHSAASDFAIRYDGVTTGSTPFYSTGTNTVGLTNAPYFGRSYSWSGGNSFYLDGWIGEIILANAVQTQSDREKIEGYLAHKWGLTGNLEAGHPYKSSPP